MTSATARLTAILQQPGIIAENGRSQLGKVVKYN
jgi:hypothetical protein